VNADPRTITKSIADAIEVADKRDTSVQFPRHELLITLSARQLPKLKPPSANVDIRAPSAEKLKLCHNAPSRESARNRK
jgi:hypothetical protein